MADFRLTQTGEQIQAILNQQPLDHTALDGHIENSVIHVTGQNKTDWDAKYNKPTGGIPSSDFTQAVQEALVAALSAYQKPNNGIPASDLAAAVQSAIDKANSAYQKPGSGIPSTDFTTAVQDALVAALSAYQKPNAGIPQSDLAATVQAVLLSASNEPTERQQADAALQLLIQQVTNSLVNYYLKSETYSRAEVNDLVAAVGKFQSKIVSTLPTPSIDTTGWIYLVPSTNPETQNVKEEYITVLDGSTYKWEHIGSTNIDLSPYSTTEQMNTAINTALQAYTTTENLTALLAQKQDVISDLSTIRSGAGAGATALQPAALNDYYTKQQADALLGQKQNTLTFDNVPTENSDNPVKSSGVKAADDHLQGQITTLQNIVADIETIAEGYVRVAGASNPALNYRSYSYHEQGGFGRESVFSLFYPCLVGTPLTGSGTEGKVLHVLQKFGARTIDGSPKWLDIYNTPHAIDGSEGDVLIVNIEDFYSINGKHTIEGTEYDVFLMSRTPFTWQGIEAEHMEKFGWAPDYTVAHQDTDNVIRMHSVYNPAWNGSYSAPVGVTGKYIYTTDPDTGDIVETYDANETLLGGAGGLHSTDINLPNGEQYAMNMNADPTKTVPWMNQTAEGCNRLMSLILAEGGTFDAHNANLMGSGFCSNDPATAAGDWEQAGSGAKNGIRFIDKNGATQYRGFGYMSSGSQAALKLPIASFANLVNSWRNPWHMLEANRAISYAIENDVHELEWFTFEGNKYKYRSVNGFNGPSHGEMTCVIWKMLSTKFTSDAKDPSDGTTSLEGNRVDILVSTALIHGMMTQVSPLRWTSGLLFTEDENGQYECYLERDQAELVKGIAADNYDPATPRDFETIYDHVLTVQKGEGYAKNYLNGALMLPDTNANKSGAGLHTYVGKYNWFTGGNASAGKKSVRGFLRGNVAVGTSLSPLTLDAGGSPSAADSFLGFGTCCRITE